MARKMFENLNAIVANTLTDSIKMIDISELHESDDNFFQICRVEELADTILGQGGVKDNLIVRPMETGGYEIISGHRRRAAVKYLIDKGENVSHFLPCLVQEYADEDSKMLDIILMNVSARQLTDSELWQSYEKIDAILKEKKSNGEKFGRVRETLAEMLGVSAAQVGKMQNVEKNAIPEVKEAVANGDISISTANEVAKLDKKQQEQLVAEDLSSVQHKDVKKLVESKKSVKWDGAFAYDVIKEHLLKWVGQEAVSVAKHMKNNDFADYIRKANRSHGQAYDGINVNGSFDKITISFSKPTSNKEIDDSDITDVSLTWTMAARLIRAWAAEDSVKEQPESAATITEIEGETQYIDDTPESLIDIDSDSEKVDICINFEDFVAEHISELETILTERISDNATDEEKKVAKELWELIRSMKV